MPVLFIIRQHPIIYIVVILIQTILLCIIINIIIKFSWFSYILFLIFLGGLIVLFIYITRLASNEKFTYSTQQKSIFIITTALLTATLITNSRQLDLTLSNRIINSFKEIYHSSIIILTALTITYLLLTLIVVIKIVSKYKGPLRNLIN